MSRENYMACVREFLGMLVALIFAPLFTFCFFFLISVVF